MTVPTDAELDAMSLRVVGRCSQMATDVRTLVASVRALRAEMREVDRILADAEMADEVDYTFDLIGEARRTLKREEVKS